MGGFTVKTLDLPIQWKTKTEMIYHMMKDVIISGELKPGERIVNRKLASDLGVSAIPVREAVKLLEAEGLVILSAYSEVTVSRFSEKDYRELFEIRILLEKYGAQLATEHYDEEFIQELEQLLEEMRSCIEKEDYKSYGLLNRSFHQTITSFSHNNQLQKIIDQISTKTDRARGLFVFKPQRARESLKEHEEIVEAIKRSDSETAVKILEEQARVSFNIFLKHFNNESTDQE